MCWTGGPRWTIRTTVFAAGLLAVALGAEPARPAELVVAVAAEVSQEGGATRLTFTLSKPVSATTFLLDKPDRAIIDLAEVNFQFDGDPARRRGGVVSSVRGGLIAPGRSRVVVELAGPATVSRVGTSEDRATGATLLQVEFARTDREAFRRLVAADRADLTLSTASIPSAPNRDTRPLIAIDAGHGGSDPGATAPTGTLEKDITLAFAEALKDRLSPERYRILMIRDHDVFVPLEDRVRRAREAGADLFLSIHADIISNPQVSGGTLYVGGEMASDVESATLADRENEADVAGGFPRVAAPEEVAGILHDLTARETRTFSHRFSGLLLRDLGSVMRFSARPQREAGFRVLRSPDLPSVLVELGYLSNHRDLDLMTSPEWRRRTAVAMASALDRFFGARLSARAQMSP